MSVVLVIKVIPSAGKVLLTLDKTGKLVCYLKSAPERNKANEELLSLLSKKVGVTRSDVFIVSGVTSKRKQVMVKTPKLIEEVYEALGIAYQSDLERR